jgi:hypothetical protein
VTSSRWCRRHSRVAIEPPRIEARVATAHMDSAPGDIVDIGGVLVTPVRSMLQTDSV